MLVFAGSLACRLLDQHSHPPLSSPSGLTSADLGTSQPLSPHEPIPCNKPAMASASPENADGSAMPLELFQEPAVSVGAGAKGPQPRRPAHAPLPGPSPHVLLGDKPLHTTWLPSSDFPPLLGVSLWPPPGPHQPHKGLACETGNAKLAARPVLPRGSRLTPLACLVTGSLLPAQASGAHALPPASTPWPAVHCSLVALWGWASSLSPSNCFWEHVSSRVTLKGSKELTSLPLLAIGWNSVM